MGYYADRSFIYMTFVCAMCVLYMYIISFVYTLKPSIEFKCVLWPLKTLRLAI